jgi:demethylmenaquinone methyltransferase/2-methoxy-6-polyprenyl-1,4-benzoquinol methylase
MHEPDAQPELDKSEVRIRRMFGAIAGRYDLLNHLLSAGIDKYWRWRAVRAAPLAGNAPILDVCTGTGDLALAWWRGCRRAVSVIGTDFTREMLLLADRKTARERGRAAAGRSFVFLEADAQRLPFADGQFQIVSAAFGLRNVTSTARGLSEMCRVCAPGGRVVVLEFSLPANGLLKRLYLWYFQNVLPRLGQWISGNREQAYNYLPSSVARFPQGEELCALMRDAGLARVDWRPLTFGIATLYIGTKA